MTFKNDFFGDFENLDCSISIQRQNSLFKEYSDQIYCELSKYKYISQNSSIHIKNIFKQFFTQEKAVEYFISLKLHFGGCELGENTELVKITPIGLFAEELSEIGTRKYIVSSFEALWNYCYFLEKSNRHLYEVILENQPCWLYFDIEYNKDLYFVENDKIISLFTKNLINWFFTEFGVILSQKEIIYLNSTTNKKFSYHIIVKYVNQKKKFSTLFSDNLLMRIFVNCFLDYLERKKITIDKLESLYIQNIIDKSVYTRNRCFRMLFSSKFGKKNFFQIDEKNTKFELTEIPPVQLFRSMVTFLNINYLSNFDSITENEIINKYCINLNNFGFVNKSSPKLKIYKDNMFSKEIFLNTKNKIPNHLFKTLEYVILFWNKLDQEFKNNNKTPHILLEKEISKYCIKEIELDFQLKLKTQVEKCIYSIVYINEHDMLIVLPTKNNKFCLNINREHVSNGIKLIINNSDHCFYQKCFDPDCERFKSKKFLIPDILSSYSYDIKELDKMITK